MPTMPFLRAYSARAAVVLLVATSASAAPNPLPQYTIEDFLATTNMNGADFSPDGSKILGSSDATGVFNAYTVPVAGGAPVQMTTSTTNAVFARAYFPFDDRFLYTSDQGGNELNHVYVQMPDGTSKDITPGAQLKAEFVGWAHDGKSFFVTTNERDKRYFDLYEVECKRFGRTLAFQNDEGYDIAAVSRDKRWLALGKTITRDDANVYLYDRRTKTTVLLTEHQGDQNWQAQEFSPDGQSLYLTTDQDNEFAYLVRRDLKTAQRETVLKPDWDVQYANFSKSGRYLVVGVNADARTDLRVFEAASMTAVPLPKLPAGDITSVRISDDDRQMAFYLNGSRSPSNLHVCALDGGAVKQLTQNLSPKIDPEVLVEAEVVRFKSYDGLQVPGILYKPHQMANGGKLPALVNVHGGPGGQSRVGYSGFVQYLVNHGYMVYSINNRGSSGYGKSFYQGDDRKHSHADLDDCVASKQMLIATGAVDPNRIGIMGGSYGGYMTLAALAFRPQEFTIGVDLFGVANWVRTLESIPSWWESERKALYKEIGDPTTDAEYLKSISPLFHTASIRRPLLVLQGKNDPRVLKVESDEIVAKLQAAGVPVQYVTFDDEGHGFRAKKNQITGYKAVLDFCDKYLAAPTDAGSR